jgi:SAM-dependent methyltransferase
MTEIVGLAEWLAAPAGRYLLDWESQRFDSVTADMFGYHALQLGLAQIDALRANRMPYRWTAVSSSADLEVLAMTGAQIERPIELICDFSELPFASQSLDLVVLPHTLEFAADPHTTLREVERVLVPEGRVVICGFNNWSLWGLRQVASRRLGAPYLPTAGDFIGYKRIKDWLRLLGLEFVQGSFGCYRPPCRGESWLDRWAFMDKAGARWWPVLGAAYFIVAVKRVRAMRWVGPAWKDKALASGRFKPVVNSSPHRAGVPVAAPVEKHLEEV